MKLSSSFWLIAFLMVISAVVEFYQGDESWRLDMAWATALFALGRTYELESNERQQ